MKSAKFLEDLKKAKGIHADKDLAALLGVTKAAVSQYKSGARVMDNEMCLAVAMQLDIDPMRVIMAADIDRAERAGQHSLWEVFTKRMAAPATVVLTACVTSFVTPGNAEAASRLPLRQMAESLLYLM